MAQQIDTRANTRVFITFPRLRLNLAIITLVLGVSKLRSKDFILASKKVHPLFARFTYTRTRFSVTYTENRPFASD